MNEYLEQFESLLGYKLKLDSKGQAMAKCPFHNDKNPSLSINVNKGIWNCFAGCGGGSIYSFAKRLGKALDL
ncbi:MAG: hypothetical protein HQ547_04835 [Candidatus Omnitrophica bacterium]|nr:hypothetical protein [Candidatus Omnitrophota bacterium]